jgi:small subunit ribosomal protein S2
MITVTQKDLLKAGVHLGHLSRKWNPSMAPFIFMESRGIHIIDLNKTLSQLQEAADTLQAVARAGKKILFVATKKQAKELVAQTAKALNMPYMTERWLGGTLTNFITIRRLIKKLTSMERMMKSAAYKNMAKKEQLMIARDKDKLERVLGGVLDLTKLPGALVVVDIMKENIAVQEARKLGIPIIALADTNADPNLVDYPIPSNDDATPAIELLIHTLGEAINQGLSMRQEDKAAEAQDKDTQDTEENKGLRARGAEKVDYNEGEGEEDSTYGASTLKAAKSKPVEPVEKFKRHRTNTPARPHGAGINRGGDKSKKSFSK